MTTLFDLALCTAIPFWTLMILLPTWSWSRRILTTPWIILPTLLIGAITALPLLGPLWTLATNPDPTRFHNLLTEPGAITAIWATIIAADLFLGRWLYLDSRTHHIHPLLTAPLRILTALLSPIGLPLYLAFQRNLTPIASAAGQLAST